MAEEVVEARGGSLTVAVAEARGTLTAFSSAVTALKDAREEADRRLIRHALLAHNGNLSRTAKTLDVDRGTLRELMKKYGIREEGE
jgi:DNA-binding NtrC family response regulator